MTQVEILEMLARIDVLLNKKSISHADFYAGVGLTAGALSLWRKGKTKPRITTIEKIASYLDVSVAYLLGQEKEKVTTPQNGDLDEESMELIRIYQNADETGRKLIRLAVQSVAADFAQKNQPADTSSHE